MFSFNIASRGRSKQLPANIRRRFPDERRSVSRSATRALDVMTLFAQVQQPLRAVAIAQALRMKASTTGQLLKTLVESGHLLFSATDKTYFPSPRLVRFGLWLAKSYFADARIAELLDTLRAETGEVVGLFAQYDIYMQVIDIDGGLDPGPEAPNGALLPIFGSASGAALLAEMSPVEVEALMERARIRPPDRPELHQALETVRANGYAFGGLSIEEDASLSIAMCLPRTPADILLVVGLGGPREEFEAKVDRYVDLMKRAIAAWSPAPPDVL